MYEVRVIDESNEIWFTEVYPSKFKWLREGQIVKIKNASLYDQVKATQKFSLRYSSNILTIPSESQTVKMMNTKDDKAMVEADRVLLKSSKDGKLA